MAKEELGNEYWLRMVVGLSGRSFKERRVIVLEFLDTDIFHLSREHCVSFLDPLIESWDIDLATFALDIVLNPRVVSGHVKRFEFGEREAAMAAVWNLMRRAGRTDRGRSLAVKTERKPHLVRLKPKCADAYAGKLQVGREYQALFSLENAKYMSIVGTDVTHALKAHFDIRQP